MVSSGVKSLLSVQLRYKMNKNNKIPLDQGENQKGKNPPDFENPLNRKVLPSILKFTVSNQ